jgi:hypothetical protein
MQVEWWKLRRIAAGAAALRVMLLGSLPPVAAQEKPYPELDQQLQVLKKQFNADVGKVRVLVIVDPT